MYRDHTFQEKLQAYISGALDAEKCAAFEAELEADDTARAEAEFSRNLAEALSQRETEQAAAVIRQVVASEGFPPPASGSPFVYKLGISFASLVLLAVLSWAVYSYGANRSWWGGGSDYLVNYLFPLENVIGIPDESLIAPVLQNGLKAYEEGDYQKAASLLGKHYLQTNELNAGLYYGTALLLGGQPKTAVKVLEAVRGSNDLPVRESAEWYLALAYLKTDKVAEARALLNLISPGGLYGAQAKQLLKNDLKQ